MSRYTTEITDTGYEATLETHAYEIEITDTGYETTLETHAYEIDMDGTGASGANGLSAYQIAVINGYTGTEEEYTISFVDAAEFASIASAGATIATDKAAEAASSVASINTQVAEAEAAALVASGFATSANTSAINADASANEADGSATQAATSADSADTSAGIATGAAATATTKAADASASANAASTSETNASGHATNAGTSAATASTKAGEAVASATLAGGSATAANTSAGSASTAAATATTKANEATTAANEAFGSANAASGSATTASTAASNASSSATVASTAASSAETSANAAATSATTASTSAGTAATKATEAVASASNAEAAAVAAASSLDSFEDKYLGAKSVPPTTDNDGNALVIGALYFDSVSESMRVRGATDWVAAYIPGGSDVSSVNGRNGAVVLTKSDVNLGNVDNTSDANKPVSTATQTALNTKAPQATTYNKVEVDALVAGVEVDAYTKSETDTLISGVTKSTVGLGNVDNTSDANKPISTATQTALNTKAPQATTYNKVEVDAIVNGITKAMVGLGNVDNTSDANKPISTATQTALNTKAPQATTYNKVEVDALVAGVTKSTVGLGNVDNTSDANKPVSTATQTALNAKANQSTTYTKTEVDSAVSSKANSADVYTKTEVDLSQADQDSVIAGKMNLSANTGISGNQIYTPTGILIQPKLRQYSTITNTSSASGLNIGGTMENYTVWSPPNTANALAYLNTTYWSPSPNLSEVTIELINGGNVINAGYSVIFTTNGGNPVRWLKTDGSFADTPALAGITWKTGGTDFVRMWTRDGGVNIYAIVLSSKNGLGATTYTGTQTFADQLLVAPKIQDQSYVVATNLTTSAIALDYTLGSYRPWSPPADVACSISSFSNWPASGSMGEMILAATNLGAAGPFTTNTSVVKWVRYDGAFVTTPALAGITWQTSGIDFIYMWTIDGGTTVYAKVLR